MPVLENNLLRSIKSGGLPDVPTQTIGRAPDINSYPSFEMFKQNWTSQSTAETRRRTFDEILSAPAGNLVTGATPLTNLDPNEVAANSRYKMYRPGANMEDIYGQTQGILDKAANATLKGLSLAGTTFLQGTVGLLYGLGNWAVDGKFSSFYNNDFSRALDDWNKGLEDHLPNYYTAAETNADWYSPKNLFTANFLFDKVIKNLGFAAGAAASGMLYSGGLNLAAKALGSIPKMGRMFSVGKNLEAAAEAEALAMQKLATSGGLTNLGANVGRVAEATVTSYNLLNKAHRTIAAGLSTMGEASFEALHNLNQFRDDLIKNYEAENGMKPTGAALEEINKQAENVGDMSFKLNAALLTATNYIQFPRILGTSYTASKKISNGLAKDVGRITQKETGEFVRAAPRFGKFLNKLPSGRYFFSPTEAFEEGAQYAIQTGSQNYWDKKNRGEDVNFLKDVIGEGFNQVFNTKEGIESILIGGLSGAIMTARGTYRENKAKATATTAAIDAFNKSGISPFLKEGVDAANRAITLQENFEQSVDQGDILESKDIEFDYAHNYLTPRIKYNRFDLVMDDIDQHRALASTPDGFAQLQLEGKASEIDTQQSFLKRLDNLERHAQNMHSMYQSLNVRYGGMVDKEGKPIYPEEVLDKMVYVATKIADYDQRLPELVSGLDNFDITVEDTEDLTVKGAIDKINSLKNVIEDTKDDLKFKLRDALEIKERRKTYIDEYSSLKNSPQKHTEVKPLAPLDTVKEGEKPTTVKVVTSDGEEELEVGKEYYLGSVIKKSKEGKDVFEFPRFTIIGTNPDGTIQIRGSNGAIRNIKPDDLIPYKIGSVADTQKDKKAKYFLDHINDEFEFNFGKGNKPIGRLEYNSKKGILNFVYTDARGKKKSIEVTGDQFKPKKGFAVAQIRKVGTLTAAQEASLKDFTSEEDKRLIGKREARLKILEDAVNEIGQNIDSINSNLRVARDELARTEKELDNLTKEIESGELNEKKPFRKSLNTALRAAKRLSNARDYLLQDIARLEAERTDLEFNLQYFYDLSSNIDELPTDTEDFLEELKTQTNALEDMILETGKNINTVSGMLSDVERVLQKALDFANELIRKFETTYPKAPTNTTSQQFIDFIRANPNFLKINPRFKDDVAAVEEMLAEVDDLEIQPNEKLAKELRDELDKLQAQLEDVVKEFKAKSATLEVFEKVVKAFREEQKAKEEFEANKALHTAIFGEQKIFKKDSGSVPTPSPADLVLEVSEMNEQSKKKRINIIGRSTATPSADLKPHHVREQFFLNNVKRYGKGIVAITVTQKTQDALGFPGLVERLHPDSKDYTEVNNGVVAIVYGKMINGRFSPIDQFGEVLGPSLGQLTADTLGTVSIEESTLPILDEAVYSVLSSTALTLEKTPRYYSAPEEPFTQEQYQEAARRLREQIFALEGDNYIQSEFTVSRGIPIEGKEKQNIIGSLATIEDLSEPILSVSTSGVISYGENTYKVKEGRVVMVNKDTVQLVNNRNFNEEEQENLFNALLLLAKRSIDTAKLDPQIMRYLQGMLFWGDPQEGKAPSRNQVWVAGGKIHMGKNDVVVNFTPNELSKNKQTIKAFLSGTYNNVNNHFLKGEQFSIPFNDIKIEGNEVEIVKEYPSYQHFLLTKPSPMLTTTIIPTEGAPNGVNFEGKYVILDGVKLDLKTKPKEKPKEVPKEKPPIKKPDGKYVLDGKTLNTFVTSKGEEVKFKIVLDDKGEIDDVIVDPELNAKVLQDITKRLGMKPVDAFNAIRTNIFNAVEAQMVSKKEEPSLPVFTLPFIEDAKVLDKTIKEEIVSPSGKTTTRDVKAATVQQKIRQRLEDLQQLIKCLHG